MAAPAGDTCLKLVAAGSPVAFLEPYKIPLLLQAPGGFMVLSLVAALFNKLFHGEKLGADWAWVSGLCEEKEEEA